MEICIPGTVTSDNGPVSAQFNFEVDRVLAEPAASCGRRVARYALPAKDDRRTVGPHDIYVCIRSLIFGKIVIVP